MAQIEYKMAAMWAGDEFICIFCILTLMSILNNTSVYLGRVSMLKKNPHTCMHTHANTHIHIHVRTFFFSGSDDPYTHVCEFFHGGVHYTPPPHQQGWSKGTQDGMSVKAWEREEKSWACSHRPDSWLCAHNKDPCTGAWHPSGWSRQMHKQTRIQIHTTTHVHPHTHTHTSNKQYIKI